MISKAQIKNIRLLHQKKYRDEAGLFIAEGPKIVNDLLNSPYIAREVFALKEFRVPAGTKATLISAKELEQISCLSAPYEVLGIFEIPPGSGSPFPDLKDLRELAIALDDIRDPGNLGSIIRIADWFGIKYVLCSKTCVDLYNPKVVQATMGSLARVQVRYVDLPGVLNGYPHVYGAVLNGRNIYREKLPDVGVILIGNEAKGISDALLKHVAVKLSVPGFSKGADSLNAAIATAIICSEFRRSRSP